MGVYQMISRSNHSKHLLSTAYGEAVTISFDNVIVLASPIIVVHFRRGVKTIQGGLATPIELLT